MQMRTVFIIGLTLATSGLAAGCGSEEDEDGDGTSVVATTGIVAEIAGEIAGRDGSVEQMIPDGASPHDFELSAQDRVTLDRADIVVANGAGLEAGIPLDGLDAPVWELAEEVDEPLSLEGDIDPHVWMDPTRVAGALPGLAAALAEVDPDAATAYRKRGEGFAARLRALNRELSARYGGIPADARALVTSHDSLGYLADRYELEVVATAFPSSGPEAEPSAARLNEVLEAIRNHGVRVVFAGEEDDPETLKAVAEEAGVDIETGLLLESPGSAGTYAEMLRRDAELISSALGG